MDSLKEIHWGAPKNIAFLLEGNYLVCQNIQAMAIKYLGRFQHLFFPNALEMNLDYLEQNHIDLVVTNYSEYVSDQLIGNWHLLLSQFQTQRIGIDYCGKSILESSMNFL